MPIVETTVSKEATTRGVKMAVYARTGMGKTTLLRTAPKPVIISRESGLLCLSRANQLRLFGEFIDVPVWRIETLDDLIVAHEWLSDPSCPYETGCLDSVSEIAENVLSHALTQCKDPRQAYGELHSQMVNVFKSFRDIDGKHIVFVAKEANNKDGATPLQIPDMPGSRLGKGMGYYFDELFHLDIAKAEDGTQYRFLQTQPSLQFDAKDRSGALEPEEEPNLTKIINKIVS